MHERFLHFRFCYGRSLNYTISIQGPVVQSIVSLTSSLMVKVLTVLVSKVSNSQVFLLKKNVSSFCICESYSHFFSKDIIIYAIFNNQVLTIRQLMTWTGPRSLVDKRVDSWSIRFLTAVVRAWLGSYVGKPSSAYGWSGGFSPGSPVFVHLRWTICSI